LRLAHVEVVAVGWWAGFASLGLWVALLIAEVLLALADGGIAQTALAARTRAVVEKLRSHACRGRERQNCE